MTALPQQAWSAARWRDAIITSLFVLPWCVLAVLVAQRVAGASAATLTGLVAAVIWLFCLLWRWRQYTAQWVVRELNTRRRDMEDSADLLADTAPQTALQHLQRQRLLERLTRTPAELRRPWPYKGLLLAALPAVVLMIFILVWPAAEHPFSPPPQPVQVQTAAGPVQLTGQRIEITPPAYTRLPARTETLLSAKAPQGATLHWQLQFAPDPKHVAFVSLDGQRIALTQAGTSWQAQHVLKKSMLYRLEIDGVLLDDDKPYRLDALADRPPQVRVLEPARSLTLMTPGQRDWLLRFEAQDDYAVAANASLRITLAQGSGENVSFREHRITLQGHGEPAQRVFTHRLDLSALQLERGDDLIVQLEVQDNRVPEPHIVRSPSVILRWQPDLGNESTGVEAITKRVLPAYFRSQRQIIIDAEALQKEKRKLSAETFVERSDGIGVDQRILRLRYGQFLGEEAEDAPKPPASDDDDAHEHDDAGDTSHAHAHDTPAESEPQQGFGQVGNLLEEFGHTHDIAEAATLLDPETRATLKQALDQMWQSELHLRQGHPDRALPFAYKALEFIKQVQQATRIYLARVGPELPPIDFSRRLSGKRDGLQSRDDMLQKAQRSDADVASLWQQLSEQTPLLSAAQLNAFQQWVNQHAETLEDPLSLQAAVDVLQRQPDCVPCREELRALLWPVLALPPAHVTRRAPLDAQGQRYLDALENTETEAKR
jgi:hypothetical protein